VGRREGRSQVSEWEETFGWTAPDRAKRVTVSWAPGKVLVRVNCGHQQMDLASVDALAAALLEARAYASGEKTEEEH